MVPQVAKLLRKERLSDATLCKPAREVVDGILGAGEADLGGGLFKKRLPRPGAGKSGGFRAIVAYRPPQADRILITYAFAKTRPLPSRRAVMRHCARWPRPSWLRMVNKYRSCWLRATSAR
jgi:hypothetical protein